MIAAITASLRLVAFYGYGTKSGKIAFLGGWDAFEDMNEEVEA